VFPQLNKWFDDNLLLLNYEITQYIYFTLKGTVLHDAPTGCNNNFISNSTSTKFFGVIIENTLSWKTHINHLLSKLCMACYSVRTIKSFMCQENLVSIYYSYFHSSMTYGIIWGNSTHSIHVFLLQKRVIRIITDSRPRDFCWQLFKKLGILPLMSQYIFFLHLLFIVNNKALFQMNSEIHGINTRNNSNFHRPLVNLTTYKNGAYYTGIKVFNYLPTHIKNLSYNVNQFRLALRDFLHFHSLYSLEKYFNSSHNLWTQITVK
jgi:hypothetical protein